MKKNRAQHTNAMKRRFARKREEGSANEKPRQLRIATNGKDSSDAMIWVMGTTKTVVVVVLLSFVGFVLLVEFMVI